jgi:hypothetical protein
VQSAGYSRLRNAIVVRRSTREPAQVAARTPVGARPPLARNRPAAHPVLELHRTIGNRAVGALLQRSVGFEFEFGASRIEDRTDPTTPKRLPKGATGTWATADGLDFQADDTPAAADESVIEFVTKPFDETAPERTRLDGALGVIESFVTTTAPSLGTKVKAPALGLGGVTVTKPEVEFVLSSYDARPQATVGVRLDKLGAMMRDVFPGVETSSEAQERDPMREALTYFTSVKYEKKKQKTSGLPPPIAILAAAPRLATQIADFHSKNLRPQPTDKLVSLVGLLYSYLNWGKAGLAHSYAKTIATVMARTDFGTLFSMLSKDEKDFYKLAAGKRWVELVQTVTGFSDTDLDAPLFAKPLSKEPNEWYRDLTRRAWLTGIADERDLLTAQHYPTPEGRQAIEGLGGYGSRADPVGRSREPGPIFEFRVLGYKDMTQTATWRPMALSLFDYVVALNRGEAYTWGTPYTV